MVRQYQVVVDPQKLAAYGVTAQEVTEALQRANQESGGGTVEMAEAEYIVRASGYLKSLDDFRTVPIRTAAGGIPVTIGRSEEHTSELQSLMRISYAVFCLKKK